MLFLAGHDIQVQADPGLLVQQTSPSAQSATSIALGEQYPPLSSSLPSQPALHSSGATSSAQNSNLLPGQQQTVLGQVQRSFPGLHAQSTYAHVTPRAQASPISSGFGLPSPASSAQFAAQVHPGASQTSFTPTGTSQSSFTPTGASQTFFTPTGAEKVGFEQQQSHQYFQAATSTNSTYVGKQPLPQASYRNQQVGMLPRSAFLPH